MTEYFSTFNIISDKKLSNTPRAWTKADCYSVEIGNVMDLVRLYKSGMPFVRQFPNNLYETKYLIFDFDQSDKKFFEYLKSKFNEQVVLSPSSILDPSLWKCKLFYELDNPIKCTKSDFDLAYHDVFLNIISGYVDLNMVKFEKNKHGLYETTTFDGIEARFDYDKSYSKNLFQFTYGAPITRRNNEVVVKNGIKKYRNLRWMTMKHGKSRYVRKAEYEKNGLQWNQKNVRTASLIVDNVDWSTYWQEYDKAMHENGQLPFSVRELVKQHNFSEKWYRNCPHVSVLARDKISEGHRHNYLADFIFRLSINAIGYNSILRQENSQFIYNSGHLYRAAKVYISKYLSNVGSFVADHNNEVVFRMCYRQFHIQQDLYAAGKLDECGIEFRTSYKPRFSMKKLEKAVNGRELSREEFTKFAEENTEWSKKTIKQSFSKFKKLGKISTLDLGRNKLKETLKRLNMTLSKFEEMPKSIRVEFQKELNTTKSSIIRCLKKLYFNEKEEVKMARFYQNWKEAYSEIKRDLSENGTIVKTNTMQNKVIGGNPLYETKEIRNYDYVLLNAKSSDISNVTQPWADAEFEERISMEDKNPGEAWKLRKDVWEEFLVNGKQSYTYQERYNHNNQLNKLIEMFKRDMNTRQGWLSVWDPSIDPDKTTGVGRVPCTLGYHFIYRNGKLHMHNVMRSCDLYTHFCNDVYLGIKLLEYVASKLGVPVGNYEQTIFSLHTYRKNFEKTIF